MSTVVTADPRIERAGVILRECGDETAWPRNREARFQLEWAKASLTEALDTYARFLGEHLPPFPGDVTEALDAAAWIAEDEAARLEKLHRRHVRRGAREQVAS